MESERNFVIDLTPDQVLAASLKALGISSSAAAEPKSSRARILAAYREAIQETGRLVTSTEISQRLGICNSRVAAVARSMWHEGTMLRTMDAKTGKVCYVPKAEG